MASALLTSALPGLALAQQGPVSADPEFVYPRFGHDQIIGVPVPSADERNTVRWGLVLQYQRNPVTGYRLDEEVATIVANRLAAHVGVSWDFARWGTAHLVLPVAGNWGYEIEEFNASGFGLGDINLGLQLLPYQGKHFHVGVYGDLWMPTGRSEAYIGEESIRGGGGLAMMGRIPFKSLATLELVGDAAVLGRRVLVTSHDFDSGSELHLSQAARLRFKWTEKFDLAFTQALIARGGFTNFFNGGAENGLEVYGGLQVPIHNIAYNTDVVVDVMAGRGTNQGFGTTDFRMLAGLTFSRNPGRRPVHTPVVLEPPPAYVPPAVTEDEPPPPDAEAFVVRDRIEIRKPIQFVVGTSTIKVESQSTLQAVADIINADARIKHLVIEGHASEEGEYDYNYDLSKSRAESIYKQLILNGVAPDRMSYRGMGEVRPRAQGSDESALAANRRVEFHIVATFGDDTLEWPDYGEAGLLPWSGERWKVITPPSPDEIEEQRLREMYEKQRRDDFRDDQLDELRFQGEASPEADVDAVPAEPDGDASEPAAPEQPLAVPAPSEGVAPAPSEESE